MPENLPKPNKSLKELENENKKTIISEVFYRAKDFSKGKHYLD